MPDSSRSPVSVVNSGLRERDAGDRRRESCLAHERRERRLRLPGAAIDHDFAAPVQPEIGPGMRKIREIPANADVAQLVEHFTRNEGVPGSSPGVGFDAELSC